MALRMDRTPTRLRDVLAFAASLAVLTGGIQVAIQGMRREILGEFTWTSPHYIWMTPVAYAPCFFAIALLIWFVSRLAGRPAGWRSHTFWMAWFGALCISMLFPSIAHYARAVLSLGIALQLARLVGSNGTRLRHTLRTISSVGAAAMFAAGGILHVGPILRERAWLANAEELPGAPNVLIIILDTVRAMSMGVYGHDRATTPVLDAIAQQGVVFDRAYSPAPWTLPAHASLLTGRYPHELTANHLEALDDEFPTLAERFRERGYATGAVVANLHYAGRQTGIARGFLHYDDADISFDQVMWHAQVRQSRLARDATTAVFDQRSTVNMLTALARFEWSYQDRFLEYDRRWAPEVNRAFLDWLDYLNGQPFFAMLNYFDAHDPYEPPDGFGVRYDSSGVHRPLDAYEGAIEYLDRELGTLIHELRDRAILDRTILVITSDHGEQFGEHGLWGHSNSLFPQLMHVPLILRFPHAIPSGVRIASPVSTCDIANTVLELALMRSQPLGTCASLVPILSGEMNSRPSPVLLEMLPVGPGSGKDGPYTFGIVSDSLYFVTMPDGREAVFHHRRDPTALVNTIAERDSADLESFRAWIRRLAPLRARSTPVPARAGLDRGVAP